jgi:hypothetical protein
MAQGQGRINEMNFKKFFFELEIQNKHEISSILETNKFKELNLKAVDAYKLKITEQCNKIFSDIHYFSKEATVNDNFEINSIPFGGKEKEVEILKDKWNNCVNKYKDLNLVKNNTIKNIYAINQVFLNDCIDNCKIKRTAKDQKLCLFDCFDYHKINCAVSAKLLEDSLLKYFNNLQIV